MKKYFLIALALSSSFAIAQQDYKCDFEGVRSVKVPVYPDRPDSKQFNYQYQVIGNLDPDKMVIINLPGGPGGSSMNDFSIPQVKTRAIRGGLPENIPWIMIDPRTSGCNRATEEEMPDDSLNSTNLAHDVLSVIETLKLKKYIIHGHSYGSQHGTFVAGLAKERGLPAPHALFLSGILGRGEKDGSFSIPNNLILEWNLIKATLSPKAQAILNSPNPLGYEDWEWEGFISSGLYSGYELYQGKYRNFFIELLSLIDEDDATKREALHKELRPEETVRYGYSSNSRRLYKKVDCHEFSPDDGHTLFVNGSLVFDAENNPCADEPFDRPYDSADFEITSPIYYLAGTNDPAAPYKGAVYHFDNQIHAQRNFITVNRGGHLKLGYILGDCRDEIWNAIFQQKNLDDVIPNCKADIKLEIRD